MRGQREEGEGQAASRPTALSTVLSSGAGDGPWSCSTSPRSSPTSCSEGCACVCMGVCVLLKPLLLSTVPSAATHTCSSSHCSAALGDTFPTSSSVRQTKTFSHQGANGPRGTRAACASQGTWVMPARETHANLLRWDTWPWLPAA